MKRQSTRNWELPKFPKRVTNVWAATHFLIDPPKPAPYPESRGRRHWCRRPPQALIFDIPPLGFIPAARLVIGRKFPQKGEFFRHKSFEHNHLLVTLLECRTCGQIPSYLHENTAA